MEMDNSPVEQMDDDLDLRQYLSLFLHWAWLIILAAAIAGAVSYFFSIRLTPFYRSSAIAMVNVAPASRATDYSSVVLSEQLTSTYSQMMVRDPVVSEVAAQLGLSNSPTEIKDWITVTPVRDTQLIQVSVETTNPELSAKVANSIVSVFGEQIQELQAQRFSQSKATLETQLKDIESQVLTYSAEADRAITTEKKDQLEAKVTQYREIYSNLLLTYEQVRLSEAQSISSIEQVEPAVPNSSPVRPNVLQNTLLAAVVGLLLAAGAIVAREALDDTINTPEDITRKFKLPILGVINHHNPEVDAPITVTEPRSPTAEAYRKLRTNVSYASVDHSMRTIMITSAEPGEGKSTTIANLGVVLAQNGKRVTVADCDLRHPRVHAYFGLPNRHGMTTLFAPHPVLLTQTRQTQVENLSVITTGSLPPNPSELLGSQKMQSILEALRQTADIILIDTPPILAVTDATALAPSLDGVLLVVRPGKTRASAVRQSLEQLHQVNARVLGVVLNDVMIRGGAYGYRYNYYRNYNAYQKYYGPKVKGKE